MFEMTFCVRWSRILLLVTAVLCVRSYSSGQDVEQLPLFLRYDAGGIDNVTKAVQWSPDGRTLYVAGWNKVVQVYSLDEQSQQFHYTPRQNFRIPIEAGRSGMIEAMVVSPNGRILVVAGSAWNGVRSQTTGYLWPRSSASETDWQQTGTIYVFDIMTRECRVLRGHQGGVRQLTFVENGKDPTKLVSLGFEYSGQQISQSVRLWSLETAEPIGKPLALPHVVIPPSTDIPPRIQAWESAKDTVHVAIAAWRTEGATPVSDLMIWNPAENGNPRRLAGAPVALSLQVTGNGAARKLFCGGLGPARLFSIGDGQQISTQQLAGLASGMTPFASAVLPATDGRSEGRMAVASIRRLSSGDKEYHLSVLEGTNLRQIGTLWVNRSTAVLPAATLIEPAISVSPDGRFLCVSGSSRNEIRVYRLSDLLSIKQPAGELPSLQILSGRLLIPDSVVFARREQNIGIAVSDSASASLRSIGHGLAIPENTVVVDADERTSRTDAAGWTVLRSDAGRWQTRISQDRHHVEVSDGASAARLLRVPSAFRAEGIDEEVTAHAVCTGHGENPPLVAVATHAQGEPFVHIFEAESGQCLRELTGHERRITDLAFSADGKLLVSASLDGTVRCWTTEDLESTTIGRVGWVRGLLAESAGGQVHVERIETDSPAARAGVREGDVVSGIVTDGQFDALETTAEYYLRVSQSPPRTQREVMLRLRRGTQSLDRSVPLDQGADMREPLFSMLLSDVAEEHAAGAREWLVWSPLGQFDVGSPELEQRLGWHINTGNDSAPVSFSSIDQYRGRFLQEGLLKQLLNGTQVVVRKAVQPEMRLSLITSGGDVVFPNYEDELVLREAEGQLILEFEDQTGELVGSADWSAEEQPVRRFSAVNRDLWKSPISATDLGRNQHLITVRVVSNDVPPVEHTQKVFLRYQPEAPQLKLESPVQTLSSVESDRLTLRALVDVAVRANVTVVHELPDGQRSESSKEFADSGILTQEVVLKPGRNIVRISAANAGIPDSVSDDSSGEEATLEAVIEYAPVGPPRIVIDSVVQQVNQEVARLVEGKLRVDTAELTIRGSMEGDQPLKEATLSLLGKPSALKGFVTDVNRKFEFSETLRLEPGEQEIVLSGSAGGDVGKMPMIVVFQPPLPAVTVISPSERDVRPDASAFDGILHFEAQLDPSEKYPFDYRVLVDSQPVVSTALSFDSVTGVLMGNVPVRPDSSRADDQHRVEIQLSNQWERSLVVPLTVRFLHPPKLLSLEVKRTEGTALADIDCHVETSASRPVTGIGLRVNGFEIPAVPFRNEVTDDLQQSVVLPGIALIEGTNEIEVSIINQDGISAVKTATEIVPPTPQKATVRMIRPLTSETSSRPVHPVVFVVKSEPGLQRVNLVVERDFRIPQRISLMDGNLLAKERTEQESIEQTFEHQLELTSGVNRIRIEVQNRGGVTAEDFAITYLPPPVSVSLKRLVTANGVSSIQGAEVSADVPSVDSAVIDGTATLVGDIEWLPGHRPAGKNWTVRVWVNGFLRTMSVPAPTDSADRVEFQVPIVLNLPKNRLRIEAPEVTFSNQQLALQDHSIAALQNIIVACANPETRQRLHLVLMGVQMDGERNICRAEDLSEFANTALRLQTPQTAFADIKAYTPLVGEKAIGRNLRTLMVLVEAQIAQRRLATGTNDVVMFYYRGREHRAASGEFLLEDFQNHKNPVEHPQSISESYLAGLFEHLPGAHVVFLDIENGQDQVQASMLWPRFPNLGLFRVAWSGKGTSPDATGPLLTALHTATDVKNPDTSVSLGVIEGLVQSQIRSSTSASRFMIETFVPDDLMQLVIARSAETP